MPDDAPDDAGRGGCPEGPKGPPGPPGQPCAVCPHCAPYDCKHYIPSFPDPGRLSAMETVLAWIAHQRGGNTFVDVDDPRQVCVFCREKPCAPDCSWLRAQKKE